MEDITPKLLEAIENTFSESLKSDKKYLRIIKRIDDGALTWEIANEYAIRLGELLSQALQAHITPENLPDGRFYYNIAKRILDKTLKTNQSMIADVAERVQNAQNEKAKVGIKALRADVQQDRIDGLIDKVSNAEDFETASWVIQEPVVNYSQSVVDSAIRKNVKFLALAGLRIAVKRSAESGCCPWCSRLGGTYNVNDKAEIPFEVWQKHENCRCQIDYSVKKQKPFLASRFIPES